LAKHSRVLKQASGETSNKKFGMEAEWLARILTGNDICLTAGR